MTFLQKARTLLTNVNLTFHKGHKIGLVGKNGSGKTTFLKLLLGKLIPDKGEITYSNKLQFAYLDQDIPNTDLSALEYLVQGDAELHHIEQQLKKAEEEDNHEATIRLHCKLSDIDGYSARARAAKFLTGLGFSHEQHDLSLNQFSGGWRMRLKLARVLMSRAEVLLLDEPTNHLDLKAILWFERWLKNYNGTVIMISHDRDFLDNVVEEIVYIYHKKMKLFTGNYSSFEKQWAEQLVLQQKIHEKQQAKIAHLMKFVNRFRAKATKAPQAQSRLKAIERLETTVAVQQDTEFTFDFFPPKNCQTPLLTLEKVKAGYGNDILFEKLNLQIRANQRIGLIGPNGAGKSTLIKILTGELPIQQGERSLSKNMVIGYFAQNQLDELHLNENAMDHMIHAAPKEREQTLRNYLGQYGFSKDLAETPLRECSGGEKARLALALIIWKRPALLLMDEPTNHLDMEMRNALILALQNYEGSLLIISHDRYLIRATTDELWLTANGEVTQFKGDLYDYQQWLMSYDSES